jgi:2-polyprenyl-6-methoxyphenol hydroxylase-like FAD-dependent oxidoreductase
VNPDRVLIVGGGIGGMSLAAALGRIGIPYLVLERAPRLGEAGSGLGVLPGAVQALTEYGAPRELFEQAAPFRTFHIATAAGRDLVEVDFGRVCESTGHRGYVMRRAELHEALVALVDPVAVRLGAEVERIEQRDGRAWVHVRGDERPLGADVVVGADGLLSAVRRHVLGDGSPRYAGETIFRGIAELQLERPDVSRELFGSGRRAAYYDLGGGRVYWWASSPLAEGTVVPPGTRRGYLADAFAGWGCGIPALHAATPEEAILQNDVYDRPAAPRWHRGAAGLLGDAAHPTTPNLGQGACLAIEDGLVLARAIRRAGTAADAFAAFYAERRGRAARTVRLSRLWGDAGLWTSPAAVWARDAALQVTPSVLFQRQAAEQYSYLPGSLA